jgi:hypothetical protein
MQTGISLQALAKEIEAQEQAKRDFVADTRSMTVLPTDASLAMELEGADGTFPFTTTMHEQVSNKTAIPRVYYDRMREAAPSLLAQNVNHWLRAQPEQRMVRTLYGNARALVSDKFRPLDHPEMLRAVLPVLHEAGVEVRSSQVTERRLYLQVTSRRLEGEVKRGDAVQFGLVIANSEIGMGALSVSEMIYRLVCLNGAILGTAVRKSHVGKRISDDGLGMEAVEFYADETRRADDRAFFLKLRDTVKGLLTEARFEMQLTKLRDAAERKIEGDPIKVVEVTQRRLGLTDGERGDVLRHLVQGGDLSAWGLANAVTRLAHDSTDYDRSVELERLGARVIELPKSEWQVISQAA